MDIESDKNSKIKDLVKLLDKSRNRKTQRKFIVEGIQENFFALQEKFQPLEFFIQPQIFLNSLKLPNNIKVYEVSQLVYNKIAYRKNTEGIVGVYKYKNQLMENINLPKNSFILIIESVEKPGNLGAICRTADAFGVDVVFICDEKTDIYNPNVIRSSVGSFFNIPIISEKKERVFEYLSKNNISVYATYMNEKAIYIQEAELSKSCAILFGTEHSGISDFWKNKIKQNILIPMRGKIDSLNVSNAVSIACYEVERQRITLKNR